MDGEGKGMQGASCMWAWAWSVLVWPNAVPDHCDLSCLLTKLCSCSVSVLTIVSVFGSECMYKLFWPIPSGAGKEEDTWIWKDPGLELARPDQLERGNSMKAVVLLIVVSVLLLAWWL